MLSFVIWIMHNNFINFNKRFFFFLYRTVISEFFFQFLLTYTVRDIALDQISDTIAWGQHQKIASIPFFCVIYFTGKNILKRITLNAITLNPCKIIFHNCSRLMHFRFYFWEVWITLLKDQDSWYPISPFFGVLTSNPIERNYFYIEIH